MGFPVLGRSYTGAIINITRLCLLLFAVFSVSLALILVGKIVFSPDRSYGNTDIYLAIGLFCGAIILIISESAFKIAPEQFLLSNVIDKQFEKNTPLNEVESFMKTYKTHIGVAGFFNRLGFSGLSLGTVVCALLLIVIGLFALRLGIITSEQYSTFGDLAKLLFGAFIGSFAPNVSQTLGKGAPESPPAPEQGSPTT